MVNLTRIYTRTGDGGRTRLGRGQEVAKTDPRVEAYGEVDELNAALGAAVTAGPGADVALRLRAVQNDLFDVGADLCVPQRSEADEGADAPRPALRVTAAQVVALERAIDEVNGNLQPLRSFVLPGGTAAAAWLHVARAVCRRAERRAWALAAQAEVNPQALAYLNRLSDLLFVLSRAENARAGQGDVLWEPGQGQKPR